MKLVGELALRIVEREVALMHQHGIDDDLLGDLQELLVERTNQQPWDTR